MRSMPPPSPASWYRWRTARSMAKTVKSTTSTTESWMPWRIIETANGKPLLVAYWYKHDLERIRQRFDVRTIDTPKDIADWNEGKISVALIHPASAGHGLNLQDGGSTIVWFGLTWSLELYQQLNARLWRQGQKHTAVILHIVTEGTHDEDIMNALEKKDMSQTALIAAVKARIGGVT